MKKNLIHFFAYGFLIWLTPFIVSLLIFPLKSENSLLYSKILTLVLAISASFFTYKIYQKNNKFLLSSIILGFSWVFISVFFDLLVFLGPIGYNLEKYLVEIPTIYLIIPIITVLAGFLSTKKSSGETDL